MAPFSALASFQSTSRTITWNNRKISYNIVPKDAAAKTDSTVTTILMEGNKLTPHLNGATHALQLQTHDWEKLSPDDQNSLVAATGKVGENLLNHTNPQAAQAFDKQFAPDAAEKMKATFASALPLLKQNAEASASGSAKVSFEHGGRKYKIHYQLKEDGSAEVLCIGGKLGAGGESTVLKMVGIDMPKNLNTPTRPSGGFFSSLFPNKPYVRRFFN